jgi:DNA primase
MKPTEELRAAADIVKVVGHYVKLRKAGTNLIGLCPFHQEKTPSFAVHPVRQIFHCFGCGVGGDVFKFVMLIENLGFPEAVERVAGVAGVTLPSGWHGAPDDPRARERTALLKLHEVAAHFFSVQLGATAEGRAARAYLADRGINDETVARFQLGYAPAEGQALARKLAETGFSPDLQQASGLLVPGREGGRPLDRFRRRAIFPIANESGKVVAFAGRALGDDQPKYLNSPETPIYTKSRTLYHLHAAAPAIRKLDRAILVEGYMDCIALASSGLDHVVASCGTSLTESQVRLLARYTQRVVVNFDPDSAGIAATERSLGLLLEEGFEICVLPLGGKLDPDSFVRLHGAEAYRERLSRAPAYLDYLADRAAASHDVTIPEGKVRAANAVLPYLVKVGNPLLRDELASRLAERLRLDERLLKEELKRAVRTGDAKIQVPTETTVLLASPAEKSLLRAFVESRDLATEFLERVVEEGDCKGLPTEALFVQFLAEVKKQGKVDLAPLLDSLKPQESAFLFTICSSGENVPDRERVVSSVLALKRWRMERERASLQTAIKRAEREGNRSALGQLIEAKNHVLNELAKLPRC